MRDHIKEIEEAINKRLEKKMAYAKQMFELKNEAIEVLDATINHLYVRLLIVEKKTDGIVEFFVSDKGDDDYFKEYQDVLKEYKAFIQCFLRGALEQIEQYK